MTLLIRLVGPLQSWGVSSHLATRDTGREPSKSGVVGLLGAALGRQRYDPIDDLAALTMGVRVDQEGCVQEDFQTAQGVLLATGKGHKDTEVIRKFYLADARFLVGLAGDDLDLLTRLHAALRAPHWPLYLGRKAFVPSEPVWLADGLHTEALVAALQSYPWLGNLAEMYPDQVRLVLDDPAGAEVRPDQPLSFADRRFVPRRIRTMFVPAPPMREDLCTSPN